MRRKFSRKISLLSIWVDFFCIIFAGLAAMLLRYKLDWSEVNHDWYIWYFISFTFVAVLNVMILYFKNSYQIIYKSLTVEIPIVIRSYIYSATLFIIITFFVRFISFSRLTITYFFVISIISQVIAKVILHYFKKNLHKKGYGIKRVLFIGCNYKSQEISNYLTEHIEFGFRVIGCLCTNAANYGNMDRVGEIEDFEQIIKDNNISTVIISLEDRRYMESLVSFCELNYLQVYIIPDILDLSAATIEAGELHDIPMLIIKETMLSPIQWKVKRIFDFCFSMLVLAVTLPFLVIIAILIKLTSPGPVVFAHKRLGHNNEVIKVLKFRTMVENAEAALEDLLNNNPELREEYNKGFKLKDDPRITKIGKFLRATSLDELPQIFNILAGEMSWVGPRPIVPDEIERYGNYAKIILRVPPGITGYWQTNGRSDTDYEERIKLDIYYINNWSFLLDMMIILRTIPVVVLKRGAY